MHMSCMQKFHCWAEDQDGAGGVIAPMEVLDAAWRKKHPEDSRTETGDDPPF
jgi:hypothetical protein